ncbi:unnamed protein product [Enterobius vermicularis]|uniref:ubiquitinyl hydrolase 1 n=1 Tax=Enterobius vermicularis TaxID=51028 RepID=A0A0N4VE64_ENTVE|nr:unnamed protein product [Enterobius vermicularis]
MIRDAKCDKCTERKTTAINGVVKKHGFCRLPSLLVLRVERVIYMPSGYVLKRNDRFSFPEILDVEKFCFFSRPQVWKLFEKNYFFLVLGGYFRQMLVCGILYNGTIANSSFLFSDAENLEDLAASISACSLRFKYRLRAVSVHMGEPESGHFITYRRGIGSVGDTAWYKTSDSQNFRSQLFCNSYITYWQYCTLGTTSCKNSRSLA